MKDTNNEQHTSDTSFWFERFIADLSTVRPFNTVKAHRQDLVRWLVFCKETQIDALVARPTDIIQFLRTERERPHVVERLLGHARSCGGLPHYGSGTSS